MTKKTLLSWSSGKDSAWALHRLRQDPTVELNGLFTTLNEKYDRVNMHATQANLLRRQADAVGLSLYEIRLPDPCPMEAYNDTMGRFVRQCRSDGIECMAFGDLFLADIREFRENQLKGTGIEPCFPLWGNPTRELAEEMISAGVTAYISSVDLKRLPVRYAGRPWTLAVIDAFPEDCDPCGENGEIHTIVVDGPMFRRAISVSVGDIVTRDGFAYADIIPLDETLES